MPDEKDRALGQLLTLDFVEKLVRLDVFLRRAAGSARRQDAEVVKSFVGAAERIRRSTRRLFDLFGRLWPIQEIEFLNAIQTINQCFLALDRLHLQLSLIHVGWPTPETYTFVEETCAPLLREEARRISIVLSDVYMFEETELGRYLGSVTLLPSDGSDEDGASRPALFLPKIEHENPLQWGILIHEIGHSLEFTAEPLLDGHDTSLSEATEGRVTFDNWAEEVLCDLLALHLLGPAYLVSFISFINLMGPVGNLERATDTHPDPRFRLSIMSGILERFAMNIPLKRCVLNPSGGELTHFFLELFELRCAAERRWDVDWRAPPPFPMDFSDFRDLLEDKAAHLLPEGARTLPRLDADHLEELVKMLKRGIPIGGQARRKSQIKNKVEVAFSDIRPEESRMRVTELLDDLGEDKCTVAEILTAGWLYKTEILYPRHVKCLFTAHGREFDEAELQFRDDMVRLDELLRKSIEVLPLFSRFGSSAEKKLRQKSSSLRQ